MGGVAEADWREEFDEKFGSEALERFDGHGGLLFALFASLVDCIPALFAFNCFLRWLLFLLFAFYFACCVLLSTLFAFACLLSSLYARLFSSFFF